jgi:hypothetical protein
MRFERQPLRDWGWDMHPCELPPPPAVSSPALEWPRLSIIDSVPRAVAAYVHHLRVWELRRLPRRRRAVANVAEQSACASVIALPDQRPDESVRAASQVLVRLLVDEIMQNLIRGGS